MSSMFQSHKARLLDNSFVSLAGEITTFISARGKESHLRIGWGEIVFDLRDTSLIPHINSAKYAEAEVLDRVAQSLGGSDWVRTVAFILIRKIKRDMRYGRKVLVVSGPDLMHELTWRSPDIGVIGSEDGNRPALDDIQQIMSNRPAGWSYNVIGTAAGTYHTPRGESIFVLLKACAEQSGDYFRLLGRNQRYLEWVYTPTTHPVTLQVPSNPISVENDTSVGVILSLSEEITNTDLVTRVRVYGAGLGEERLDIGPADGYWSAPTGFTVDFSTSTITNTAAETAGNPIVERYISFPDVKPLDGEDEVAERTAAGALASRGLSWLQARGEEAVYYRVEAVIHRDIRPLNKISVEYTEAAPDGTVLHDIDDEFLVLEVELVLGQDGWLKHKLLLSNSERPPRSDANIIVSSLQRINQTLDHAQSRPSGTPAQPADHGDLTGLGDDDHQLYLRADGNRTLIGNLVVGEGYTLDGVDLSAHATDEDAHHNWPLIDSDIPATLVRDSRQVLAGDGLTGGGNLSSDITVTLGTPTDLSVLTTNGVTSSSHTHSIVSSSSPGASSSLLSTTSNGYLTLQRLGVGVSPTELIHIESPTNGVDAAIKLQARPIGGGNLRAGSVVFDPDADVIALDNGSVRGLVVDEDGYVGIGTTSPNYALDLESGNTVLARFLSTTDAATYVEIGNSVTSWDIGMTSSEQFAIENGGLIPFRIKLAAPQDSLIINNNGNIGVGYASPSQSIHVVRSASLAYVRLESSGGYWDFGANLSDFNFVNAQGAAIVISGTSLVNSVNVNGAAVGIGYATSASDSKFNVAGGVTIGSGFVGTSAPVNGIIVEGRGGYGQSAPDSILHIGDDIGAPISTSSVILGDNSSTVGVSIGQSSTARLDIKWVHDSTESDAYVQLENSGGQVIKMISSSSIVVGSDTLQFVVNVGQNEAYFDGLDVGFGTTSPVAAIDVSGQLAFEDLNYVVDKWATSGGLGFDPSDQATRIKGVNAAVYGDEDVVVYAGTEIRFYAGSSTQNFFISSSRVEVRYGSSDQFRISYDDLAYADIDISSLGTMVMKPVGDLVLDPDGDLVLPGSTYQVSLGNLQNQWLQLHVAELWASTLVANEVVATIGGQIIVSPTTTLTSNLSAISGQPVKGNLLCYFDFSETSGNRIDEVAGLIASEVDGTLTAVSSKNGDGLQFATSGAHLLTDEVNVFAFMGDKTFSVWLKWATHTGGNEHVISRRGSGDSPEWYLGLNANQNKVFITWEDVSGSDGIVTSNVLSVDSWHHIVVVYTHSTYTVELFADGVSQGTASTASPPVAAIGGLAVGYNAVGTSANHYEGELDELAVFNYALPIADISWLYNSASGRYYSDLVPTASMSVSHNEMNVGDVVVLKSHLKIEFMKVVSGPTGSGPYTYTVERDLDSTGANDWYEGDAVVNTGQEGDGFVDIFSNHSLARGTVISKSSFLAYYKLDENSGANRVDSMANAPDLLEEGGAIGKVRGVKNNAVNFVKSDARYLKTSATDLFNLGTDLSICFWYRVDHGYDSTGTEDFLGNWGTGGNSQWLLSYLSNERVRFLYYGDDSANHSIQTTFTPTQGVWHLVTVTWNAENYELRLYIDSSLEGSGKFVAPLYTSSRPLGVGGRTTPSNYSDVNMDNLFFVSRVLSQSEIDFVYNKGNGRSFGEYPDELVGIGPSIVGNVRTGQSYNSWSPHWAMGNMHGLYGYGTDVYGVGLGQYGSVTNYLTIDATNGIRMFGSSHTLLAKWLSDEIVLGSSSSNHLKLSSGNVTFYNNLGQANGSFVGNVITLGLVADQRIIVDSSSATIYDGSAVVSSWVSDVITLGQLSDDRIVISPSSGVEVFGSGGELLSSWVGTTITLGQSGNEHVEIASTGIEVKDGATVLSSWVGSIIELGQDSSEHIRIASTGIEIKDGSTVVSSWVGTSITLGRTSQERIELDSATGIRLFDSSGAVVSQWQGSDLKIGATSSEHVRISSNGIELKDGTVVRFQVQPDGDIFIGSDISTAGNTYVSIFSSSQTYNGESVGAGDMLLGSNDSGSANVYWDNSTGRVLFRGGVTTQAYVDTNGSIVAGGGDVTLDDEGITIVSTTTEASYIEWSTTFPSVVTSKITAVGSALGGSMGLYAGTGTGTIDIHALSDSKAAGVLLRIYSGGDSASNYAFLSGVGTAFDDFGGIVIGSSGEPYHMLDVSGDAAVYGGLLVGSDDPFLLPNDGTIIVAQGASDVAAIVLKSSDVSHGITSEADTDTYGFFAKYRGNSGGVALHGFKDTADSADGAVYIEGTIGETAASTATSTSARGVVIVDSAVKSGTGRGSVANNGNLLTVQNNGNTQFIVKGDGDIYTNGNHSSYDSFDDAQLLRTLELMSEEGIHKTPFDDELKYSILDLIKLGIVASESGSHLGFVNLSKLNKLLSGAIWQGWIERQQLKQRISELESMVSASQ